MSSKRSPPKKTVTLRLPAELVDEFRTLVRDYAGKPHYLTVTSFLETAISKHLAHVKRQIDSGSAEVAPPVEDGVSQRR